MRICSNIYDFNSELCRINVSLLLNGYPPHFITKQFHRLLHSINAITIVKRANEQVYYRIHHTLLHQPTRREKQLNKMMQDPVKSPLVLESEIWNCKVMYPHYLFDSEQSMNLRRELLKWWKEYYAFAGSSACDIKVRLVADIHRTLETFFIQKKPPRQMLTKMDP